MDGKEFLDLLGGIISLKERGSLWPDTGAYAARGMRHNSTALNFYGASKKSLHKPRATSGNRVFYKSYGFSYYLQLLCLQFLSKTHLNKKNHFWHQNSTFCQIFIISVYDY